MKVKDIHKVLSSGSLESLKVMIEEYFYGEKELHLVDWTLSGEKVYYVNGVGHYVSNKKGRYFMFYKINK